MYIQCSKNFKHWSYWISSLEHGNKATVGIPAIDLLSLHTQKPIEQFTMETLIPLHANVEHDSQTNVNSD